MHEKEEGKVVDGQKVEFGEDGMGVLTRAHATAHTPAATTTTSYRSV